MPIYEYRCPECGNRQEMNLPMSECSSPQICSECGLGTRRRFSPVHISVPVTGRDRVLGTLNREEGGYKYPGGEMHGARYDQAMAKGLDQTRPVIGRGFGHN